MVLHAAADAGEFVETPIYARATLGPDAAFDGPAIVEQMDTTVLIPPFRSNASRGEPVIGLSPW